MDFSFTEEQNLIRNTVQSFLADNYDFETRRAIVAGEEGFRRDYWQQFSSLGLLAAPFPEDLGGLGGGPVEVMITMQAFGSALVVEPYVPTVVLCGTLLQHGGNAKQRQLIQGICDGSTLWSLAFAEPQSRFNLADVQLTAKEKDGGYVLQGQKAVVLGAPYADKLIVVGRTSGARFDQEGITLFLVDKNAKGVSLQGYPTVDGHRAAEVTFDAVEVASSQVLGAIGGGYPLLVHAVDKGIMAVSAEATGAMKVLNDATVEYSKTRKQFGVPIGKFQVLQHRMVDMFMAYEQSLSMVYMMALKMEEDAAQRTKAASSAKVQIGKAGYYIGEQSVQIHGGMGMTDELNIGHYFKRLTMINTLFGDSDYHLKRYGQLRDA